MARTRETRRKLRKAEEVPGRREGRRESVLERDRRDRGSQEHEDREVRKKEVRPPEVSSVKNER